MIIGRFLCFVGPLPSVYAPTLQGLYVSLNSLTGTGHHSLWYSSYCVSISVYIIMLLGAIPTSIGTAASLAALLLDNNLFTGTIPSEIGNLSKLVALLLNVNSLEGSIPETFALLTQLKLLYLSRNGLTGSIPGSLYTNCTEMVDIRLSSNSITGTIPPTVSTWSNMVVFDITTNHLTATIPEEITDLKYLVYLLLYENELTGSIPSQIGDLPLLAYLKVDTNRLTGSIPTGMIKLRSAVQITLYENSLTNTIPTVFQTMSSLDNLQIQSNFLTGKPGLSFSNVASDNLLQSLDISNNLFTGTIPYELFLIPNIATIAAVSNCFEGELTDEICNAPLLQVLAFDGLASAAPCQEKFGNLAYVSKKPVFGSIPSCIWGLTNLATLHLSGNGFRGELTGTDALESGVSSLKNLSLAYNRLSGTIPLSIQTWPHFNILDLGKNWLGGDILEMDGLLSPYNECTEEVNNCSTLSLDSNRLSGDLPSSFTDAYGIDILSGNLFQCQQNNIPIHDDASKGYICGSITLNISMYLWMSFAVIVCCCLASVKLIQKYGPHTQMHAQSPLNGLSIFTASGSTSESGDNSQKHSNDGAFSVANTTDQYGSLTHQSFVYQKSMAVIRDISISNRIVLNWLLIAAQGGYDGALVELSTFVSLLNHLRFTCVVVLCLIWFVNAPIYSLVKLNNSYSTHTYQYSWYISAALMQGYIPAVILCVTWILILFAFLYLMVKVGRKKSVEDPSTKDTSITLPPKIDVKTEEPLTFSRSKRYSIIVVAGVINASVVLVTKGMYLYVMLSGSTSFVATTMAQICLAVFDLIWNWSVVTMFLNWFATVTAISRGSLIKFKVMVFVFNSVVASCIVAAVSDPDCLKNLFVAQDTIVSVYSYPYCYTLEFQDLDRCAVMSTANVATSYNPPFMYDFQCGSAMITDYVPVFMFVYIFTGFVMPAIFLFLIWWGADSLPRVLVEKLPGIFFPGATDQLDVVKQDESTDSSNSTCRGAGSIVVDTSHRICSSVAKPESLVSSLMHHFVVLLTFGIAFPPLAFVITFSLVTSVVFWKALIGRYIQFYRDRVSSRVLCGHRTVAVELLALQVELVDAWKGSRSSARIITVSSSVFFGLFFFDITAGEIGWNQAFAFPVALFLGPLIFFRVVKAVGVVGAFDLPLVGKVVFSKEDDEMASSQVVDKPNETKTDTKERPSLLDKLELRASWWKTRENRDVEYEITPRNTATTNKDSDPAASAGFVTSPLFER